MKYTFMLPFPKLFLLFILISSTGCMSISKMTGHTVVKTLVDQEYTAKRKREILQISNDLFTKGEFRGRNNIAVNYRILNPELLSPGTKYPLVMVFHGSGDTGTDNTTQMRVLVKMWAQPAIRSQYPAYVVAVQFPQRSSNYPGSSDSLLVSSPAPCLFSALDLIDSLKKVLPIDADKVYAVGFSMGGSTVNNSLAARPDLFAAGISISGIPSQKEFEQLKNIPIWLIHGNADRENTIRGDIVFYDRMKLLKHSRTFFWEIDQMDHEVYGPLYTTDIIPKWLFSKSRRPL